MRISSALSKMKYLSFSAALMIVYGVLSCTYAQQRLEVPDGWVKINVCQISFFAPSDMKDLGTKGADSCVAQFANNDITLYLDYGPYGGPPTEGSLNRGSTEQLISIDGKDAKLLTYIDDTHGNSGRKYDASLYVLVKEPESKDLPKGISLMMWVQGQREKDQEIAQRIFRTIRFEHR